MRVLQIIDSLNPGGAERMAVNLANALVGQVSASYLCCTRKEGMLKSDLREEVGFIFLDKKNSLDLQAFYKLRQFVNRKKIDLIHVHGTSCFWGVLLKISRLNIILVWHDHYGDSEQLKQRKKNLLKPLSRYFDGVISVNEDLKNWANKELNSNIVKQLNNFIVPLEEKKSEIYLHGRSNDFKVICVANLRQQKDHLTLLKAFERLEDEQITLHLVGGDPETPWSRHIKEKVREMKNIYYYGSLSEVPWLLGQADLGILSSRSEGLPLALMEYGMAGLPVVATRVGQCEKVSGASAILVPPGDAAALSEAVMEYYRNPQKRTSNALDFSNRIKKNFSKDAVMPQILEFYDTLIEKNGCKKKT